MLLIFIHCNVEFYFLLNKQTAYVHSFVLQFETFAKFYSPGIVWKINLFIISMAFVSANAYGSFFICCQGNIALPFRAVLKGVLLKPKILFSSLYNCSNEKKNPRHDRIVVATQWWRAKNSNNNNKKSAVKIAGNKYRRVRVKPPFYILQCLSLDEINRMVKIKKEKNSSNLHTSRKVD